MAVLDLVIGRQPIFDREHRVVGDKLVYCNAGTGVLTGDVPILLPPDRTVLEVLETVEPTDEVVEGCRRLVRQATASPSTTSSSSRGSSPSSS
jgi:EAL and modified HD-GYP domain-containing signal transduction protein